jgi:hypothetical protein
MSVTAKHPISPGARGAHSPDRLVMPLSIGMATKWGQVVAVGWTGCERYYWCVDSHGCTSMTPAITIMVEEHNDQAQIPPP